MKNLDNKKMYKEFLEFLAWKSQQEEKPSKEEKKVSKKTSCARMASKKLVSKETKAEKPAVIAESDKPTEKQMSFYLSLCDKTGTQPLADLTKKTISPEIAKLCKALKTGAKSTKSSKKPAKNEASKKLHVETPVVDQKPLKKTEEQTLVERLKKAKTNKDKIHSWALLLKYYIKINGFNNARICVTKIAQLNKSVALTDEDQKIFVENLIILNQNAIDNKPRTNL